MPVMELSGTGGVAFIVSFGIVAEIIAKCCSSPQTAQMNADKRAPTLMKWVNIGIVESAVVVIVAAYIDPKHRREIIAGGTAAAVITYGEYLHALKSGLADSAPGTEDW